MAEARLAADGGRYNLRANTRALTQGHREARTEYAQDRLRNKRRRTEPKRLTAEAMMRERGMTANRGCV